MTSVPAGTPAARASADNGRMLTAVLAFVPAAALLVLAPGPDTLLVLRNSARRGRLAGLVTAAGTVTGLLVWATAAAVGLAALVRASQLGYDIVRIGGAVYLVGLGSRLLWHSRRAGPEDHGAAPEPAGDGRGIGAGYLAGAATNLLNPKVGVFFVSFLPAFIPAGDSVALVSLLLGGVYLGLSAIWLSLVALLGDRLGATVGRPNVRKRAERLTGLVMIGFGVRLAIEQR
jgi:threonine/homoserine/homoserine lactone efflux protein